MLRFLARHFGSVFVLALAQRAEGDSPYAADTDATRHGRRRAVHEEVVRGLATRGRDRLSGNFRAAVFGANDGLVSNLALVMGIGATGVASSFVLFSGIAGLLAGALSMAAGEFVSVRSQRELLSASKPTQITLSAAPDLDLDANELVLVYRARGMSDEDAAHRAAERMGLYSCDCNPTLSLWPERDEKPRRSNTRKSVRPWEPRRQSFCFFASGAVIPILPFIFGMERHPRHLLSAVLVGIALLATGGVVGLLSGASPTKRGLRQLAIGLGAAGITYALGLLFGGSGRLTPVAPGVGPTMEWPAAPVHTRLPATFLFGRWIVRLLHRSAIPARSGPGPPRRPGPHPGPAPRRPPGQRACSRGR